MERTGLDEVYIAELRCVDARVTAAATDTLVTVTWSRRLGNAKVADSVARGLGSRGWEFATDDTPMVGHVLIIDESDPDLQAVPDRVIRSGAMGRMRGDVFAHYKIQFFLRMFQIDARRFALVVEMRIYCGDQADAIEELLGATSFLRGTCGVLLEPLTAEEHAEYRRSFPDALPAQGFLQPPEDQCLA